MHFTLEFFLAVILAHSISYTAAYCMALTAFWTTEYMSVLRLYYFPEWFLSGRLFPLTALPAGIGLVASFTHFRYTNFFPVEVLLGKIQGQALWTGIGIQILWIALFYVLGRAMFRAGVKCYTGVGM